MVEQFTLDARLLNDTLALGELSLTKVLLMNDSNYPWLILVPRLPAAVEVFDLTLQQQSLLWQEINLVASKLKHFTKADKINLANLGNVVSQLHIHIIARYTSDAAWPAPVWGKAITKPYQPAQAQLLQQQLQQLLFNEQRY